MIFSNELARKILRGAKTETRRPVKPEHGPLRYRPGQSHAVQPGRGQASLGRIVLTHVRHELVTSITVAGAVAEGFAGVAGFARRWLELYDPPYRQALELATDIEVLDRLETRFGSQEVWVLTFILDPTAEPRLLHRHSERGYTSSPRDAVPDEPEAVDAAYQDRFTHQAHDRDEERETMAMNEARDQLAGDLRDITLRMAQAQLRAQRLGQPVKEAMRLAMVNVRRAERELGAEATPRHSARTA